MSTSTDFIDGLIGFTENLLTWRARRIERKARKRRARGSAREWVYSFIWAVAVVLLLNQYLLQAYQIPSGSMRPTLIGGDDPHTGQRSKSDRIFVDKLIFGPELLPGAAKLPGFRAPRRGEVIIFENPDYSSPSLAHEIAQRILYMATLSVVDLNRRGGETAHQFLIKRQVAEDGDRVNFAHGELYIQARGEEELINEEDFKTLTNQHYNNNLLLDPPYYSRLWAVIEAVYLERAGLPVDEEIQEGASSRVTSPLRKTVIDPYEEGRAAAQILHTLYPHDELAARKNAVYERGIYVPQDWVLPLGDNRSDSNDGRYFGPVPSRDILGRGLLKYWPLRRAGGIR